MAQSPAHKFGQIIGDVLEEAVEPLLREFALQHGVYLDRKGPRPARVGRKVSWKDEFGNTHDLDYVLERGGTAEKIGTPIAFIETAWRRYTKHSRNKAQEIQGAILPLVATHRNSAPFIGVILGGVFTEGALEQLRSIGFSILYFPHDHVVKAFQSVGIDATFAEDTPDIELERKVHAWESLPDSQRRLMAHCLIENDRDEVQRFMLALERAVTRQIESVRILPLHGAAIEMFLIEEAVEFVRNYDESSAYRPLARYDIEVHYTNGDSIKASFDGKESALEFLRGYVSPTFQPTQKVRRQR